jgi:hypothetical protein
MTYCICDNGSLEIMSFSIGAKASLAMRKETVNLMAELSREIKLLRRLIKLRTW